MREAIKGTSQINSSTHSLIIVVVHSHRLILLLVFLIVLLVLLLLKISTVPIQAPPTSALGGWELQVHPTSSNADVPIPAVADRPGRRRPGFRSTQGTGCTGIPRAAKRGYVVR